MDKLPLQLNRRRQQAPLIYRAAHGNICCGVDMRSIFSRIRALWSHRDSRPAEVVKLVDTLASGASGGNPVEVQVLSSAPIQKAPPGEPFSFLCALHPLAHCDTIAARFPCPDSCP